MKLMQCRECSTIVVPSSDHKIARPCDCGKCLVFWRVPFMGLLTIVGDRWNGDPQLIGLHNSLLSTGRTTKEIVQNIIKETPDTYLFKSVESCVIVVRPGTTNDVEFISHEVWKEKYPDMKVEKYQIENQ